MSKMFFHSFVKSVFTLALIGAADCQAQARPVSQNREIAAGDRTRLERFEKQLEELRTHLKIPGMSAAIVKDQQVLWSKGSGFADLERRVPATPDTLYHIASLTKTFAATLIMQLVENGKLNLDEPMSNYSSDFKDSSVKIKHLLSHTSEGTPGDDYQYNGNRYDYLTAVIEKKTGKSFRELIVRNFFVPLGMSGSVPAHDVLDEASKGSNLFAKEMLDRFQKNLTNLAQPYTLYGSSEVVRVPYPPRGVGAAAGILSTVVDMARFDAAIDRHRYLNEETQDRAWTPFVSNSGRELPHGLGWFVEKYQGLKLIWHYGHWGTGFSATYLKVPEHNLSLILLANSEALSDPFYRTGGIETNVFACAFLRLFAFEDLQGRVLPDLPWTLRAQEFNSELARLDPQSAGNSRDCAPLSHASMTSWLDQRSAKARTSVKVDSRIYEAYVGQYELNPQRIFSVTREGEKLVVDIPRTARSEMFPESESKFFLKVRDVQLVFVKGEKGEVTHLEIISNGDTMRAKRVR